jgi:intracellular sulfur oxidation DsrE/DsrF family protein
MVSKGLSMPALRRRVPALIATAALLLAVPASAQGPAFHPGPVFPDMAPIATIDSDMAIPKGAVFKVALDATTQARPGSINDSFLTAARFINTHVEAGVPAANINIGIVVHGRAILDLLKPEAYAKRNGGAANASAGAVADLLAHNVNFYVCGQSAVGQGIAKGELLPGVKMAISASSAHALLQMQGYSINPF